jgi:sigma-E factor negative regulatory protein RseB
VSQSVIYQAPGPPSQFVWESNGQVVTVVADSPVSSIDAVLEALPPDPARSTGLLSRISRGAQRLLSWANPFD